MATFHKGNGGSLSFGGTSLAISNVQVDYSNRLAEITNSGSSGWAEWQGTVSEFEFSADFVWDSTNLPDTDVGAKPGASGAVIATIGDSGKTYSFTAVIEKLSVKWDNAQDVVRGTLAGKASGAVTLPVT